MTHSLGLLSNFQILRPEFESSQKDTLDWIEAAHALAEAMNLGEVEENSAFRKKLKAELYRVGCKPGIIQKRGHVISDFQHQNWQEMLIYRLKEFPQGVGLKKRQEVHSQATDEIFEKFYQSDESAPVNMIHVSCTGYASPSSAQKLVSKKDWGEKTAVTHVYHMGCYASIPAVRVASSFSHQSKKRSDIVHTELCSLHFNPLLHAADQLVAQSLFADGFIKYSLFSEETLATENKPALRIVAIHEKIIPNSLDAMTWGLTEWGFHFLLMKEVPALIAKHAKEYVRALCLKANVDEREILESAIFAIHPGGPKILEYIQKLFGVQEKQLRHSRRILEMYGNMSSATLPHIWEAICADSAIPSKTKVLSLAFGPGLTIAGMLLEKA